MMCTCVAELSILAWCDVTGGSGTRGGDFHAIVFHAVSKQAVGLVMSGGEQPTGSGNWLSSYDSDQVYNSDIYYV